MAELFEFTQGSAPLLVSMPHDGTAVPADLLARMTPEGSNLPDTDFHVSRLYNFLDDLGASRIVARVSRYVVDLNRDPTGTSLYPGADTTGLCPTTTFDRREIYRPGQQPSADEVQQRVSEFFVPYHLRLQEELERLVARHHCAVLFDAHSIRSRVPRFFQGLLPDLNLGTAAGQSADPEVAARAFAVLRDNDAGYSAVKDGRFQGGYITRHYGAPSRGISALQLELSQKNYMVERPPFEFSEELADRLRPTLRRLLQVCRQWADQREGS